MAQQNRILIIDDNYEVALFMRTTLEIVLPSYQIKSVPSAEEAMLELNRGVSLLIADLKLPGMDGVEFIQRVRIKFRDLPIIVVTGEDRPEWNEQARAVGLEGFLRKPLEIDIFTQVVRRALGEEIPAREKPTPPPQLIEGLQELRAESGAVFVMLVDLGGFCLASDGEVIKLDTDQVASLLTADLDTSFELARMLRARQPFTIHYQAGKRYDLYTANVGPNHLLVLIFAAQRGPGRFGTIWGYAHKAVKEILPLLTPPGETPSETALPDVSVPILEPPIEVPLSAKSAQKPPVVSAPVLEPPIEVPVSARPAGAAPRPAAEPKKKVEKPPVPQPRKKIEKPAPEAAPVNMPFEVIEPHPELASKILPPDEQIQLEKLELSPEQVHAFWDRAFSDEDADDIGTDGINLKQALAQGLVPSDFGK